MPSDSPIVATGTLAGVLRITGEDSFAYLQSQFSNDLRRPGVAKPATYGLWLTRKGKVAADSLVVRLAPEDFLLLSFHTPADKLSEKVLENVIADDVNAEPVACVGVTIAGNGVLDTLVSLGLPVPVAGEWAVSPEGLVVVASRRGGESCEVLSTDAAVFAKFSERIQKQITPDGAIVLESLRVSAGIPRVPEDCGPGDLPQEAGLDSDAVSFNKGCYLGQEVMARLQSQGRATRELGRVTLVAAPVPAYGAKLFSGADEAGDIRSHANVDGLCVAMVMFRNRVATGVDSFSATPGGEPVATRISAL
jgi:folate-binding protein YgfZ